MVDGETFNMKDVMFVCGAQATADGDMLPKSFTIFSRIVDPDDAVAEIIEKITNELEELDLKISHGAIMFQPIVTWAEFAAMPIDDHTKMKALAVAIAGGYVRLLANANIETAQDLMALPWVPNLD